MRQKGMARTLGLVLVAVVIIGLGLYMATRPPVSWPSESRRIIHPAGFSLIAPPDWDHFLTFADDVKTDALRIEPKKAIANNGMILLTRVAVPVTPDELARKGYDTLTYQGRQAYSRTTKSDFTREHTRSFLFERDGLWYDLTIRRPQMEPIEAGVWLAYAESFRIEPARTKRVAAPTTIPTPTTLSVTP